MRRKFVALMLAFALIVLALFAPDVLGVHTARADDEPVVYVSGRYLYTLDDEDNAIITRYSYSPNDSSVIVPGTLDGHAVAAIGDNVFSGCSSLKSITLPNVLTSIGNLAFYSCEALTSITLPDSVTSIGSNPFANCSALTKIIVSPDHPTLATIDGVLFEKSAKRLVCYPEGLPSSNYSVPKGILEIGNRAFFSCDALTSITLPDSVTSIGDGSFTLCEALKTITLPDSVTSIGNSAFSYCVALTSITLPDGLTSIGRGAFNCCITLTAIKLPDGLTSIGDYAFNVCRALTSITLPDSVTSIGRGAFDDCYALTSITLPESVTSIGNNAFRGCDALTLTVPRDSYAAQYAKDNGLTYIYPDTNDWLNN